MDKQSYREVVGQRLKEFRELRGISKYEVAKKGKIRIEQVNAIESGEANYTIDAFFGYISGSHLYMYFTEKSEDNNLKDLIEKMPK